jgi:nucleotide-binding universal stress UspA family protein
MKTILLATTGSDRCTCAEDYALNYCAKNRTSLEIVHVVETSLSHYGLIDSLATEIDRHDFIAHARQQELPEVECRLARLIDKARGMNISCRVHVGWQAPLYCILKRLKQNNARLLVVGGRKKRLNPFSLVNCLRRKACCTVRQIFEPGMEQPMKC